MWGLGAKGLLLYSHDRPDMLYPSRRCIIWFRTVPDLSAAMQFFSSPPSGVKPYDTAAARVEHVRSEYNSRPLAPKPHVQVNNSSKKKSIIAPPRFVLKNRVIKSSVSPFSINTISLIMAPPFVSQSMLEYNRLHVYNPLLFSLLFSLLQLSTNTIFKSL